MQIVGCRSYKEGSQETEIGCSAKVSPLEEEGGGVGGGKKEEERKGGWGGGGWEEIIMMMMMIKINISLQIFS